MFYVKQCDQNVTKLFHHQQWFRISFMNSEASVFSNIIVLFSASSFLKQVLLLLKKSPNPLYILYEYI